MQIPRASINKTENNEHHARHRQFVVSIFHGLGPQWTLAKTKRKMNTLPDLLELKIVKSIEYTCSKANTPSSIRRWQLFCVIFAVFKIYLLFENAWFTNKTRENGLTSDFIELSLNRHSWHHARLCNDFK